MLNRVLVLGIYIEATDFQILVTLVDFPRISTVFYFFVNSIFTITTRSLSY